MRRPSLAHRLFGHAVLVILSIGYFLPFAWLVTTSLQPDEERSRVPPAFIPAPAATAKAMEDAAGVHLAYTPTLGHYIKGLTRVPVLLFVRNTLLVATLTVLGTILSSSLVAYGFSVLRWRGRDAIFFVMLATM
ncbi:MAG: carbohydrate ABC transporter permease, partial [Planctomycetes bacterium]|nr:carbohydrate ABC transporter permease [Planctomycetota bacterium]